MRHWTPCRVYDTKELGRQCSRVIEDANRFWMCELCERVTIKIGVSVNKPCCVVANIVYVENGCTERDAQKIGVRGSNELLHVVACAMCIIKLLCKLPSRVESSSFWWDHETLNLLWNPSCVESSSFWWDHETLNLLQNPSRVESSSFWWDHKTLHLLWNPRNGAKGTSYETHAAVRIKHSLDC